MIMALSAGSTENRWGLESTFGTAPTNVRRRFGQGESITYDTSNNATPVTNLGDREISSYVYNTNRVSLSIEAILSVPWVWNLFLKGTTSGPTNSVYTHTFIPQTPSKTFTLNQNIKVTDKGSGTDYMQQYTGCAIQSVTIGTSVDNPVNLRMNAECGRMSKQTYNYDSSTDDPDNASGNVSDNQPYTFVAGGITLGGPTIAEVESVELTLNVAQPIVYSLGEPKSVSSYGGEMRYSGRMSASLLDSDRFDKLISRSTSGDLVLLFDNDKTGANLRSHQIKLTDFTISNISESVTGVERLIEDVQFMAKGIEVKCVSKTASIQA